MTNHEAIAILVHERDNDIFCGTDYRKKVHEAQTMAIQALEQVKQDLNKDLNKDGDRAVSLNAVIDAIEDENRNGLYSCFASDNDAQSFKETIKRLPSVSQDGDLISRALVQEAITISIELKENPHQMWQRIQELPPVTPRTGHCKDCKYFEYDSVAKVDGIPLIVAHEICNKWGDGCKSREDGFCFLFEQREGERR